MKKTLTNNNIVSIMNTFNSEDSFRKNPTIKIPYEIMWALRVNLKTLTERHELIMEEVNSCSSSFLTDDKINIVVDETSGEEAKVIKPEYRKEFEKYMNINIAKLMSQTNELSLEGFSLKTLTSFLKINDGHISMPELDSLEFFVDESTQKGIK